MGIPVYFSHIVKNHANIIKKYTNELRVDNLYLDSNSIIYDCYHKLNVDTITESVYSSIINSVILKIEEYIAIIQPQKKVIVAFDGVAPIAKLEQQRNRRYKSWYQNEISKQINGTKSGKGKEDPFNSASITPGTQFMTQLNETVAKYFHDKSSTKYNNIEIAVSGSNMVGEGEHKLFDYIRKHPIKHFVNNEPTVIYGLDADLIMLCLNHLTVCPHIYLFRETPHFIQSIDASLEPNSNYYLDIPELADEIVKYLNNGHALAQEEQKQGKIRDYVFLCFFLGNDFLPHFPAINIRTGGVEKLLEAYQATIGSNEFLIGPEGSICWENVRKFVGFFQNLEEEFIVKEHRLRNSKERHALRENTAEERFKKFELTPTHDRELEKYINPVKPGWQLRYYASLFQGHGSSHNQGHQQGQQQQGHQQTVFVKNEEFVKNICINYIEGLEWTMKYYTSSCPDWRWKYKYNYPPLLQDLIKYIPSKHTIFVPTKPQNPVSELVQLCYVLPRTSLNLLPPKISTELLKKHSHWYNANCNYIWAYCKFFWESHVDMEAIDIEELERLVQEEGIKIT